MLQDEICAGNMDANMDRVVSKALQQQALLKKLREEGRNGAEAVLEEQVAHKDSTGFETDFPSDCLLDGEADFETLEAKRKSLLKQVTSVEIQNISDHDFTLAREFIKELVNKTERDASKALEKPGSIAQFGPAAQQVYGAIASEGLKEFTSKYQRLNQIQKEAFLVIGAHLLGGEGVRTPH